MVSARVWLLTFVGLVFLVGGSAGILVDRVWLLQPAGSPPAAPRPGPPPAGPPAERIVAELDAALTLTEAQRQQITTILEAHRPRVRQLQEDARQRFIDEQRLLHDEISKTLTPDQAALFKNISVGLDPGRGPGRGRPGGPPRRGR
jgi:hypothetical protein